MKKKSVGKREKLEVVAEEKVSGKVQERENRQLVWFFVVIALVFAAVLIPYFWSEGKKSFEYSDISWQIEEYAEPTGTVYHGRFLSFTDENLYYNIFLRIDPRDNDVETIGTFDDFRYGGYVSWDEDVEVCRGQLSRVMLDLTAFLDKGVGVGVVGGAASNEEFAEVSGMEFVDCEMKDRTIVVVEIGNESRVVQNEDNPNCYVVTATDCEDLSGIEKFMVKSVGDWYA